MTCPAPPPVVSLQGQIFPNNFPIQERRTCIRLLIEQVNHQFQSFTMTSFSVRLIETTHKHRWESDILRHIRFCPFQSVLRHFGDWFIELIPWNGPFETLHTNESNKLVRVALIRSFDQFREFLSEFWIDSLRWIIWTHLENWFKLT